MTKILQMRLALVLLTATVSSQCFCQSEWEAAKNLPLVNNKATVKGFAFDKTMYVSKDTLKKGFTIELQDPSHKIVFFQLYRDCDECDVTVTTIYGNKVTVKDAPVLKMLRKGDLLVCTLFKVEKAGKYYTIPEVAFVITE